MKDFEEIKEEILRRAEESEACSYEYKRAYKAENFGELLKVVTENFNYCCENEVIDVPLLEDIGAEVCGESNLYFNTSTDNGFLIVDSATVEAYGSAYVNSYNTIEHKLSDKAIIRYYHENKIVVASGVKEVCREEVCNG